MTKVYGCATAIGAKFVASVTEQATGAVPELFDGQPRARAVQRISMYEQNHIGAGSEAGKNSSLSAIPLAQLSAFNQPRELLPGIAANAL